METKIEQILKYVTAESSRRFSRYDDVKVKSCLLFDHNIEEEEISETADAQKILNQLCQKEEITKETPVLFSELIRALRKLDANSLYNLYNNEGIFSVCPRAKKYIRDSIPMLSSPGAIKMIKELINSKDLTGRQADTWVTSLTFINNPTRATLEQVYELLSALPYRRSIALAAGSVVATYCRQKPNCQEDLPVPNIRDFFLKNIETCESRDKAEHDRIIMTLKGIGNMGCGDETTIRALVKCANTKTADMETRVEALRAFRRMPCSKSSDYSEKLSQIVLDDNQDSELRINAYISAMRCPNRQLFEKINNMLRDENINQVASFVWTHLTNIKETSDMFKSDIRSIVENQQLKGMYDMDKRKFSRNIEISKYFDMLDLGAKAESNVIFSTQSFVPRSASLNLTVDMFGSSVNLLEVGGRVQGVEDVLEKFLAKTKESSQHDSSLLKYLDRKFAPQPDRMQASAFARVFGNEIYYTDIHDWEMPSTDRASYMEMFQNLADGSSQMDFTKAVQFLDIQLSIPTHMGLPLKLKLTASSVMSMKAQGKADLRSLFMGQLDINGQLRPSAALSVQAEMSVDAFYAKAGLKSISTLHTSTAADGKIILNRDSKIDVEINVPEKKMDVFSVDRKFFMIWRSDLEVAAPENKMARIEKCFGPKNVLGLELCANMGRRISSPLSGPLSLGVALRKTDTYNKIKLFFDVKPTLPEPQLKFVFDTPESSIDRRIVLDLSTRGREVSLRGSAPWKQSRAELKGDLTYQPERSQKLNLQLNAEDKTWALKARNEQEGTTHNAEVRIIRPNQRDIKFSLNANLGNQKSLDIQHENLLPRQGKLHGGINFMSNAYKLQFRNVYGERKDIVYLTLSPPNANNANSKLEVLYNLNGNKIVGFKGHMDNRSTRSKTEVTLKMNLENSVFPQADFNTLIQYAKDRRGMNVDLNLKYLKGERTRLVIDMENKGEGLNDNLETKVQLKHTLLDIERSLYLHAKKTIRSPSTYMVQLKTENKGNEELNLRVEHESKWRNFETSTNGFVSLYSKKYVVLKHSLRPSGNKYNNDLLLSVLDNEFRLDGSATLGEMIQFSCTFSNPFTENMYIEGATNRNLMNYKGEIEAKIYGMKVSSAADWSIRRTSYGMRIETNLRSSSPVHQSKLRAVMQKERQTYESEISLGFNQLEGSLQTTLVTDLQRPEFRIKAQVGQDNVELRTSLNRKNYQYEAKAVLESTLMEKMELALGYEYTSKMYKLDADYKWKQHVLGMIYKVEKLREWQSARVLFEVNTPYSVRNIKQTLKYDIEENGKYMIKGTGSVNDKEIVVLSQGKLVLREPVLESDNTLEITGFPRMSLSLNHNRDGRQYNTNMKLRSNNDNVFSVFNVIDLSQSTPSVNLKLKWGAEGRISATILSNIRANYGVIAQLKTRAKLETSFPTMKEISADFTISNNEEQKLAHLLTQWNEQESELKFELKHDRSFLRMNNGYIFIKFPCRENSPITLNWNYLVKKASVEFEGAFKHPRYSQELTFLGQATGVRSGKIETSLKMNNNGNQDTVKLVLEHDSQRQWWKKADTSVSVNYNEIEYKLAQTLRLVGKSLEASLEVTYPENKYSLVLDNQWEGEIKFDNQLKMNNQVLALSGEGRYKNYYEMDFEVRVKTPFASMRRMSYVMSQGMKTNKKWVRTCTTRYNDLEVKTTTEVNLGRKKMIYFTYENNYQPDYNMDMEASYTVNSNKMLITGSIKCERFTYDVEGECRLKGNGQYNLDLTLKGTGMRVWKIKSQHKSSDIDTLPIGNSFMIHRLTADDDVQYEYRHDLQFPSWNNLRKANFIVRHQGQQYKLNTDWNIQHNVPAMKHQINFLFFSPQTRRWKLNLNHAMDLAEMLSEGDLKGEFANKRFEYKHTIQYPTWRHLKNLDMETKINNAKYELTGSYRLDSTKLTGNLNLEAPRMKILSTNFEFNVPKLDGYALVSDNNVKLSTMNMAYELNENFKLTSDYKKLEYSYGLKTPEEHYKGEAFYNIQEEGYDFMVKSYSTRQVFFGIDAKNKGGLNWIYPIRSSDDISVEYMGMKYRYTNELRVSSLYKLESHQQKLETPSGEYEITYNYDFGVTESNGKLRISGTDFRDITFEFDSQMDSVYNYLNGKSSAKMTLGYSNKKYSVGYETDISKFEVNNCQVFYKTPRGTYQMTLNGNINRAELTLQTPIQGYENCGINFRRESDLTYMQFGRDNLRVEAFINSAKVEYTHEYKLTAGKFYFNTELRTPVTRPMKMKILSEGSMTSFKNSVLVTVRDNQWSAKLNGEIDLPRVVLKTIIETPIRNYEEFEAELNHQGSLMNPNCKLSLRAFGQPLSVKVSYDLTSAPRFPVEIIVKMQEEMKFNGELVLGGSTLDLKAMVKIPETYGFELKHEGTWTDCKQVGKVFVRGQEHKAEMSFQAGEKSLKFELDVDRMLEVEFEHNGGLLNFENKMEMEYKKYKAEMETSLSVDRYNVEFNTKATYPSPRGRSQTRAMKIVNRLSRREFKTELELNLQPEDTKITGQLSGELKSNGVVVSATYKNDETYELRLSHEQCKTWRTMNTVLEVRTPRIQDKAVMNYNLGSKNDLEFNMFVTVQAQKSGLNVKFEPAEEGTGFEINGECFIANRALPFSMALTKERQQVKLQMTIPMISTKIVHRFVNGGFKTHIDATFKESRFEGEATVIRNERVSQFKVRVIAPVQMELDLKTTGSWSNFETELVGNFPWEHVPNFYLKKTFACLSQGFKTEMEGEWHDTKHRYSLTHEINGDTRRTIGSIDMYGNKYSTNIKTTLRSLQDFATEAEFGYGNKKISGNVMSKRTDGWWNTHEMKLVGKLNTPCPYFRSMNVDFDSKRQSNKLTTEIKFNFNDYNVELVGEQKGREINIVLTKPIKSEITLTVNSVYPNSDIDMVVSHMGARCTGKYKMTYGKQLFVEYKGYKGHNLMLNLERKEEYNGAKYICDYSYNNKGSEMKFKQTIKVQRESNGKRIVTLEVNTPIYGVEPYMRVESLIVPGKIQGLVDLKVGRHQINTEGLINYDDMKAEWTLKHPQADLDVSFNGQIKKNYNGVGGKMRFNYLTSHDKTMKEMTGDFLLDMNNESFEIKATTPITNVGLRAKRSQSKALQHVFEVTGTIDDESLTADVEMDVRAKRLQSTFNHNDRKFFAYAHYVDNKHIKMALEHEHKSARRVDGHFLISLDSRNLALFDAKWEPHCKHFLQKFNRKFQQKIQNLYQLTTDAVVREYYEKEQTYEEILEPVAEVISQAYNENKFYIRTVWDKTIEVMEMCMLGLDHVIEKLSWLVASVQRVYEIVREYSEKYVSAAVSMINNWIRWVNSQLNNAYDKVIVLLNHYVEYFHQCLRTNSLTRKVYNFIYNTEFHQRTLWTARRYLGDLYRNVQNSPVFPYLFQNTKEIARRMMLPTQWHKTYAQMPQDLKHVSTKTVRIMYGKANEYIQKFLKPEMTKFNRYEPEAGTISFQVYSPFEMIDLHHMPRIMPKIREWFGEMSDSILSTLPKDKIPDFGVLYDIYYKYRPISWNPIDYIPPFKAHATISRNAVMTFDKRFYNFAGTCKYVLARDFLNRKFAVLVDYTKRTNEKTNKIISVITGPNTFEIEGEQVRLNGMQVDLPVLEDDTMISRKGGMIIVNNTNKGLNVECELRFDRCTVSVSGWYYGKTAGLMGTYDNEPATDLLKSDKTFADDEQEMANSWAYNSRCTPNLNSLDIHSETTEKCDKMFTDYTSPLRKCFGQLRTEKFRGMCQKVRNNEDLCALAEFYRAECSKLRINVDLPRECMKCESGENYEVRDNKEADVVFVVEKCTYNQKLVETLTKIASRITKEYKRMDVKFGLVGFGGQGAHYGAQTHTANGQVLTDNTQFPKFLTSISKQYRKDNIRGNIVEAAVEATRNFPFRSGSTKSIVFVPCGKCSASRSELYAINKALHSQDVHFHILIDEYLKAKEGDFKANIFGVDHDRLYTSKFQPKFKQLHIDNRKNVIEPLDECIGLAEHNDGTIFIRKVLEESAPKKIKRFIDEFAKAIVKTSPGRDCQKCHCYQNNGISYKVCNRCSLPGHRTMPWYLN